MYSDNSRMVESENALIENIKKKGENSYYYAHQPRNTDSIENAKVLEGEGIVTGGPPKLLKREDSINGINSTSIIRNYSWADHDDKVSIYIQLDENVEENRINCTFETKGFDLSYIVNDDETKRLVIRKLYKNIDPNNSKAKARKNKIVVTLKKESKESWYKLYDN
jgi:CS domain